MKTGWFEREAEQQTRAAARGKGISVALELPGNQWARLHPKEAKADEKRIKAMLVPPKHNENGTVILRIPPLTRRAQMNLDYLMKVHDSTTR